MLISEVLPLIDEAANRVYALVRETPLVPLASEGRRARGRRGFREARAIAAKRLVQTARRDQ